MAARTRKILVSAVANRPDYGEWNMAKLRKEMKRRRLAYRSTKKSDLVRAHASGCHFLPS